MTITITKAEVYDEMAKIAGYSAKAEATKESAADNTFRRNGVFDPYRELLDDVFEHGCNNITDAVAHIAPCEAGQQDDGFKLKVRMPYNWNSSLEGETQSTAKHYLVDHMMSMWMRIIENEDEDKYFKDSTEKMLVFTRLLHRKRRVGRREFMELQRMRRIGEMPPYTDFSDVTDEMIDSNEEP